MPEKQREVLELRYGFGDVPSTMRSPELVREMMGLNANQDVTGSEKKAKQRLRGMIEPVTLPDGRLSCQFHDVYSDEYCTTGEAAKLLGLATSRVDSLVQMGRLVPEMRSRPHIPGPKVRFFKKADVLALKEALDAAPVKLSSRREEEFFRASAAFGVVTFDSSVDEESVMCRLSTVLRWFDMPHL